MPEKYRPANGSEGDWFMSQFCYRCTKDLHAPIEGGCPIVVLTLCLGTDDPKYPPEWTYDADGRPTCTAFDPIEPDDDDEVGAPDRPVLAARTPESER